MCKNPHSGFQKKQIHGSRPSPDHAISLSLLESNVHQQLVALNVHHVAKCPFASASEIKPHATATNTHVADAQVLQEFRQLRVHDVQLLPLGAGANTKHRHQDEKH